MKVAIFHNFMDNIGGAEKATLEMAKALNATIYTTNIDKEMIQKLGYDCPVVSIGGVPVNAPLRQQLTLRKFRKLNLKEQYDFYIISGDWAVSAVVNHKPNIWYVYSPPRELWDLYEYTRRQSVPWHSKKLFDLWVSYNRKQFRKYSAQADTVIATSKNVQKRLKKYLHINAGVINPPLDTGKFAYESHSDYWLSVNRLTNHKRVDIQLDAFRKSRNERLVIVGAYEQSKHFKKYVKHITKKIPKNVTFLHWISDTHLKKLYANCKGFISTSKDEDFGLSALEAMASGKPVIAPKEGGYMETVLHGATGALIEKLNAHTLTLAMNEISKNPEKFKDASRIQARTFDTAIFKEKMMEAIEKHYDRAN